MDVILKLADGIASKSKEEQSKVLDEEVERFSQWLSNLPDKMVSGALNDPERALIKTYLVQKLRGALDGTATS